MPRFQVQYTTIPLSGTTSGIINLQGGKFVGLWVPTVTSAAVCYLLGSFDTTSANFVRVQNPAGSGDFTLATEAGSKAFTITEPGIDFPYLKIAATVAQAAVRSLAIINKYMP